MRPPKRVVGECPYCNHRQWIEYDDRRLQVYNCDLEDGGCDSMYAVSIKWEPEVRTFKIEGQGA